MAENSIRMMYVRNQVLTVLAQCRTVWLMESTLTSQVNLTMEPTATTTEVKAALQSLLDKGNVTYKVDEDDTDIKRWQITASGIAKVK